MRGRRGEGRTVRVVVYLSEEEHQRLLAECQAHADAHELRSRSMSDQLREAWLASNELATERGAR